MNLVWRRPPSGVGALSGRSILRGASYQHSGEEVYWDMHCLRWWLPVFLLPLPAASPFLLILFVVSYALRTKPCVYCSVIILGLMFSSCSFYNVSPLSNLLPAHSSSPPDLANGGQSSVHGTPADPPPPQSVFHTSGQAVGREEAKSRSSSSSSSSSGPSSCWIDLSQHNFIQTSSMNLGRWSAPTWRRFPTVMSQSKINTRTDYSYTDQSAWQRFLYDGIFIGLGDVGFRLKLGIE